MWLVCPLAIAGCLLLFLNLSMYTLGMFFGWAVLGIIIYRLYGYRHSELARDIRDAKAGEIPPPEPPL